MVLISLQVSAQLERRIDWVGEPNHRQPQDPTGNHRREQLQALNENTQAPTYPNKNLDTIGDNDDDKDNDLQQSQQPENLRIFAKGTFLEFTGQQTIGP